MVAYTGLTPARPLPPPEGISRQEWVDTNIDSMRLLLNGPQAVRETEPGLLLLKTVLILGGIAAVTLTLAVRSFRRSVR